MDPGDRPKVPGDFGVAPGTRETALVGLGIPGDFRAAIGSGRRPCARGELTKLVVDDVARFPFSVGDPLPKGVACVSVIRGGVAVAGGLEVDFFKRDLPGVKPAAVLGLELAGDE